MLTLEQIDHALEWAARDTVVAAGCWPDVRALHAAGTFTDAVLQAAIADLQDRGFVAVEVFGTGGWRERGESKACSIVITRGPVGAGSYGTGDPIDEEPDPAAPGTWRKVRRPDEPQSISYDVRAMSDREEDERLLTQLVLRTFFRRTYLRGMNDDLSPTMDGFWVVASQPVDLSDGKMLEYLWKLTVVDVQLLPDVVLERGIATTTDADVALLPTLTPAAPGPEADEVSAPTGGQ